jgi:hypothetical protein
MDRRPELHKRLVILSDILDRIKTYEDSTKKNPCHRLDFMKEVTYLVENLITHYSLNKFKRKGQLSIQNK